MRQAPPPGAPLVRRAPCARLGAGLAGRAPMSGRPRADRRAARGPAGRERCWAPCRPAIRGLAYDSRQVAPGELLRRASRAHAATGALRRPTRSAAARPRWSRAARRARGSRPACVLVAVRAPALAVLADAYFGHPSRALARGRDHRHERQDDDHVPGRRASCEPRAGRRGVIGTVDVPDRRASARRPSADDARGARAAGAARARWSSAGVRRVAMEVSSHALALHRVDGIEFDVAVFTNLTQDHLDFHGRMDAYRDAKARLFRAARRRRRGRRARGGQRRRSARGARAWRRRARAARRLDASVAARRRRSRPRQHELGHATASRCDVDDAGGSRRGSRSPLLGALQRRRTCSARSASALALGLDARRDRARRSRRVAGVPGRLERVDGRAGRSRGRRRLRAHARRARARAADGAPARARARLIVRLRLRRRSRPRQAAADGRRSAARLADRVVVTSATTRAARIPTPIIEEIVARHARGRPRPARREPDRRAAIARAIDAGASRATSC